MEETMRILIMESDSDFAEDMAVFLRNAFEVDILALAHLAPNEGSSAALVPPPDCGTPVLSQAAVFVVANDALVTFLTMIRHSTSTPSVSSSSQAVEYLLCRYLSRTILLGSRPVSVLPILRHHLPSSPLSLEQNAPLCTSRYPSPNELRALVCRMWRDQGPSAAKCSQPFPPPA